jgi:hypothetical protein
VGSLSRETRDLLEMGMDKIQESRNDTRGPWTRCEMRIFEQDRTNCEQGKESRNQWKMPGKKPRKKNRKKQQGLKQWLLGPHLVSPSSILCSEPVAPSRSHSSLQYHPYDVSSANRDTTFVLSRYFNPLEVGISYQAR